MVAVEFTAAEPLGLTFREDVENNHGGLVEVIGIKHGSAAAALWVRIGWLVAAVNEQPMRGLEFNDVMEVLRSKARPLRVQFEARRGEVLRSPRPKKKRDEEMAQPEPERAEEAEPDAFSISVAGVTGAESFAVRRGDTLHSLQLKVAEKLRTPPEQQLLALEGKPLQAHVLDTGRTLAAHGIAGPVSLTLSPQPVPGAAELTAALNAEAEASLRAAIEPCARPTQMKLRKADGTHKHRRWFWLTVGEDGLQVWVHWSANEDKSDAWQWKSFRSAPPKQRRVTAMRATGEGKSYLGLTMEVEGREPVIVVAESQEQSLDWWYAWRAAEEAAAHQAAGAAAVEAGKATIDDVKASQAERPPTD